MYTAFFNLKAKPFQLTPDPEFLFLSKVHKRALTYLNYGITENAGFILVTGEVGTGKTTILRTIMKNLAADISLSRINNTRVSSEQLLAMMNEDFGIATQGKDKTEMLNDLTNFLVHQYAQGSRSMIIIDEAQNLTPELLEEVRLLSNLETDKAKLLQIVLVGQPEVRKTLARPEMRQLRQRINMSCHIQPLSRAETEEYIYHRLEKAGNRNAVEFCEGTLDAIYAFSRGIPRLVNIACDFLMLSAFAEEKREITTALVKEVIGDLENENRYWEDEAAAEPQPQRPQVYDDVIRDIIVRLVSLEEDIARSSMREDSRVDILDRLSGCEQLLQSLVERADSGLTKKDARQIEIRLATMTQELDGLRNTVTDLTKEHEEPSGNNSRKKTFWGRIFN